MTGRGTAWIAALGAIVAACALAALTVIGVAAGLNARAEDFFSGYDFTQPVEFDQEVYDRYNDMYILAGDLQAVATPLLFCTIGSTFVLLAVLAERFDNRRRAVRTDQTEASTAS